MVQRAEDNKKDVILLDNQSTVYYFCNQNLVQEITPSMQTMILQTNAGNKPTSHKAKDPNYCEVWFDIEGMANIFSFAKMEDKYCITYDSAVDSAFNMHTENGIIKFRRSAEGLYYYKPNKSFFTDCQVSQAKRSSKLLHALGCPSIADLK